MQSSTSEAETESVTKRQLGDPSTCVSPVKKQAISTLECTTADKVTKEQRQEDVAIQDTLTTLDTKSSEHSTAENNTEMWGYEQSCTALNNTETWDYQHRPAVHNTHTWGYEHNTETWGSQHSTVRHNTQTGCTQHRPAVHNTETGCYQHRSAVHNTETGCYQHRPAVHYTDIGGYQHSIVRHNTETGGYQHRTAVNNTETWGYQHRTVGHNTETGDYEHRPAVNNTETWGYQHRTAVHNTVTALQSERREAASCPVAARGADMSSTVPEMVSLQSEDMDDYLTENYQEKVQKLPRQWELTEFAALHHPAAGAFSSRRPIEFTIMTYNILSQDLLDIHPYLYCKSQPQSLDWTHRRRRLLAEIAWHNPDILTLQEVHSDHFFQYMKPRLQRLGYSCRYQKRTGDKQDGCATLWKRDKFRLLCSTPVDYCRGGLLDRDNVALIVQLQPLRPGCQRENAPFQADDKLVVATTHLLFNPRRGDIKLAQLMLLMAEIDKCAYLGPSAQAQSSSHPNTWDTMGAGQYCPIIVTGDFNLEPHSPLYKFIVSGVLDYKGLLVKEMSGQKEGSHGSYCLLQQDFLSSNYGLSDFCQYHVVAVVRLWQLYQTYSRYILNSMQMSHQFNYQDSQGVGSEANDWSDSRYNGSQGSCTAIPGMNTDCVFSTQCHTAGSRDTDCHRDSRLFPHNASAYLETRGVHPVHLPLMPCHTGRLSHRLNLVSAYQHRIQRLGREAEVTTHHSRAQCTVDYIFYSVDYKDVRFHGDQVQVKIAEEGHLKLLGRYGLMSGTELDDTGGIPNPTIPSDHLCLITRFLLQ